MIVYKEFGLKAEKIRSLLSLLRKQISDAHWEGDTELAAELERKADMYEYKLSLGETHDVPF